MKKKFLPILLVFTFILVNMFQTTAFAAKQENKVPPDGTPEYAAWKQNLVERSAAPRQRLAFAANINNNRLSNDYIEYAIEGDGRFTIGTTGGNPESNTDNYKKLLYGHPSPGTSYTTFRVDGSNYVFTSGAPVFDADSMTGTSTYTIGELDISIRQVLTIIRSDSTQREDTVQIKYYVTNNSDVSHDTGVRIMFDTQLGNNDAAAFRVPGIGDVTNELELTGSNIPQYWQAFDSLVNPTVISQGTLYRNTANKPDKVQFSNWGRVYSLAWGYTVNPQYNNGDSAVSVIWEPKQLAPGETEEYVTYYGLSELTQDTTTDISVSLTGASSIQATSTGYVPNPFTVTAYILNNGNADENNVTARINLPEGTRLASGQNLVNIGSLAPGQNTQVSWDILVDPRDTSRQTSYSVDVNADDAETVSVTKSLSIEAGDATAPEVQINASGTLGSNGVFTSDVNVDITATDVWSGVNYIEYTLDGQTIPVTYAGAFTVTGEGTHTVSAVGVDNWGNRSNPVVRQIVISSANPEVQARITASIINIQNSTKQKAIFSVVRLPEGYDCSAIDIGSIRLNNTYKPFAVSVRLEQLRNDPRFSGLSSFLSNATVSSNGGILKDVDNDGKQDLIVIFFIPDITTMVVNQTVPIHIEGNANDFTFEGDTTTSVKR